MLDAFAITLEGHAYSEASAARCIETAAEHGLAVQKFRAVPACEAEAVMQAHGLRWTWGYGGSLKHHPYPGGRLARIGCAMSHYLLWKKCAEEGEMLILEHDAVFQRRLPDIEWKGICQINDPTGATPKGAWWAEQMGKRGPGVWPKTRIFDDSRPDGLAGNSAYLLKPWAAKGLIEAYQQQGVWPNDATMCIQHFPYLQELYPFITRVEQKESTTSQPDPKANNELTWSFRPARL